MSEAKLIEIMYMCKFSTKQISRLKGFSARRSTTLYDTVYELSRRFFRSLFLHVLMFFFVLQSHFLLSENHGTPMGRALFSLSFLCLIYLISNIILPITQVYKARKVIKEIHKKGIFR